VRVAPTPTEEASCAAAATTGEAAAAAPAATLDTAPVEAAGIAPGTTDRAAGARATMFATAAADIDAAVDLGADALVPRDGLAVPALGDAAAVGLNVAAVGSDVSRGPVARAAGGRFSGAFGCTRSVRSAPSRIAAATAGLGIRGTNVAEAGLFIVGAFESSAALAAGFTS